MISGKSVTVFTCFQWNEHNRYTIGIKLKWLTYHFLRLFQIYGTRKTTGAHTTLTVPKSSLDQSTIPDTPLQNNKDIEIPNLVSLSTTERDKFHSKRNQPKSYIEKLIKNIERLNEYLHKLNEQSVINDDENSSIDVYNFYQLEYPQIRSPNEHLVSFPIYHIHS